MQDGFGIDREAISKAISPKGVRSLWGATEAAGARMRLVPSGRGAKSVSQRMGLKPKSSLKPTDEAAAAGNQAANDARGYMRARASRNRTNEIIAGTAGTAAVGSLGVLGYDKATNRKSKRVSVAA